MSEQATAAAAAPPKPGKGQGKKYAGLTRNQWLIGGGVFIAAIVFILWRRAQAAKTAASGSGTTSAGSNECTDANGNPVDCGELTAQELAALQNQLDQLQSQGYGGASGGGGSAGAAGPNGTAPPATTTTGTGATGVTQPAGTPVTSGGAASTGTKTATKPAAPPAPPGVHAVKVTASSITVAWDKVTGATSYRIRVTYQSKLVTQQVTASTTATISGLGADHTYGIHVASTGPGGTGPEGDTQIKTAK
jgi:hypothetical protein